jgi:hypothetical protein
MNRTAWSTLLASRESSQDRYCKEKPPHDNQQKSSKIDPAKQDLKDHT